MHNQNLTMTLQPLTQRTENRETESNTYQTNNASCPQNAHWSKHLGLVYVEQP